MSLPESFKIRLRSNGKPRSGLLVKVTVHVTRKNDFISIHGPSNADGLLEVHSEDIRREAESDRKLFAMDYGNPDADFSGTISVAPCGREALGKALKAHADYKKYVAFPRDYESILSESGRLLEESDGVRLSAELVEPVAGVIVSFSIVNA